MLARHDKIRASGCIVCRIYEKLNTPPQIHHLTGTKTQEDHARTIGLCYPHHMRDQQHAEQPEYTSRHPNKKRFEKRYASEYDLLAKQNEILGIE